MSSLVSSDPVTCSLLSKVNYVGFRGYLVIEMEFIFHNVYRFHLAGHAHMRHLQRSLEHAHRSESFPALLKLHRFLYTRTAP